MNKLVAICCVLSVVHSQCGLDECTLPSVCPNIVKREEWGSRKATEWIYAIIPVDYVIIHHTATLECKTKAQCIENIQSIQNYHIDEVDFGDIGYNFLIGGDGLVYEGQGWYRIGAHAKGYNSKSIGIGFIGNYMKKYPTEEQLEVTKRLIECSVKVNALSENYTVLGAKQVSSTVSPGLKLYNEVKTWKNWVEKP